MKRQNKTEHGGRGTTVSSVLIGLVLGFAYCWSVFEKELVSGYGWTNTQASLPYAMFMLFYAVAMLLGKQLQDRFGSRFVCMAGAAVLSVGMLVSVSCPTVPGVTLGFGVLGGFGQASCYSCIVSTPLKWASDRRRGLISGAVTGAVGLTAIYMAPVLTAVIARGGVRRGFIAMMAIVSPVVLLLSPGIRAPREAEPSRLAQRNGRTLRQLFSQPVVRRLAFLSFSCSLYGQIIVGHIANIVFVQGGLSNGHLYVLLLSASNCFGRFACGALSDHIYGPTLLRAVYGMGMVNMLLFPCYRSAPLLVLGTILIGFGYGASHSVIPATISVCFDMEDFSGYLGLTSLASGVAGTCGPLLAGYVMDTNGAYTYAYAIGALCLGAAAIVAGGIAPARAGKAR